MLQTFLSRSHYGTIGDFSMFQATGVNAWTSGTIDQPSHRVRLLSTGKFVDVCLT